MFKFKPATVSIGEEGGPKVMREKPMATKKEVVEWKMEVKNPGVQK